MSDKEMVLEAIIAYAAEICEQTNCETLTVQSKRGEKYVYTTSDRRWHRGVNNESK